MRPTKYTFELAGHIATTVSESRTRLAELCAQYDDWPAKATIMQWLQKHDEFAALMLKAMERRDRKYGV